MIKKYNQFINESVTHLPSYQDVCDYLQPIEDESDDNFEINIRYRNRSNKLISSKHEIQNSDLTLVCYSAISYIPIERMSREELSIMLENVKQNIEMDYSELSLYYTVENTLKMPGENWIISLFINRKTLMPTNESVSYVLSKNDIKNYFQSMIDDGVILNIRYNYFYTNDPKTEFTSPEPTKFTNVTFQSYKVKVSFESGLYNGESFRLELEHCMENMKLDFTNLEYTTSLVSMDGDETEMLIRIYTK